jgi:hypothetical protein
MCFERVHPNTWLLFGYPGGAGLTLPIGLGLRRPEFGEGIGIAGSTSALAERWLGRAITCQNEETSSPSGYCGRGYRVYFVRRGDRVCVLLYSGDKRSQDRDIALGLELTQEM